MTYIPPVNGGRINATISGNTSGAGALISTGTLTLAGGDNITLSQAGNAITISGGAGGSGGGIALANSQTTYTSGTANLVASGALTIASTTGQSFNFSVPQTSSLSATGAVSLSVNGSTVSIGAPAFSAGMSTNGNTSGTSGTVSNQLILAGGNNITLSQATGAGGNTITISAGAGGAAGSQSFGMSNLGNTSGTSGIASGSAMHFMLAGGNNVTLSQSIDGASGTITVSAASQSVQTQNLHNMTLAGNTTGTLAHISSGTLTLAGGNNVTLSQNGNAVTISAGASGGGGGVAVANSQTTYTSGTANFIEGGGAITIASTTGQSFQVSVPQTSSLVGVNGITLSTNGSTISISGNGGGGGGATLSRFEYREGIFTSIGTVGQGSLSINHMYVPFNVTGTAVKIGGSLSAATNTSATTASANISLWMGIYTLNGSTLSLASSGSANNGYQWSQSGSTTGNTSINSMRQMTVPMNVNMTPGEYWMAAVISSATTYTGAAFTMYGNNLVNAAATGAVLTPIGSGTTANRDVALFHGIYTVTTAAGPTSISGGNINATSASNVVRANFYNVIFNATY